MGFNGQFALQNLSAALVAQVQFLPRHLTERAAALPHKAATPTVRYRGS
jgi:hypothetical protein